MCTKPLRIGSENQVFIDGRFLESSAGVTIVTHKPVKDPVPCLVADRPWERLIGGYNTVLYADDRYRLWYTVRGHTENGNCIAYAVSDDGIRWQKPDLGFASSVNSGQNNIVLGFGAAGVEGGLNDISCHVFEDPNHTDRFAMLARLAPNQGLSLLRSADGVEWCQTGDVVLDDGRGSPEPRPPGQTHFHLDSQNVVFWDDRIDAYVAYVRRNFSRPGQFRTIARGTSADLNHFASPGEMDVVVAADTCDPADPAQAGPRIDFYTNAAIRYPWAADAYFMFPSIYYRYDGWFTEVWGEEALNAGVLDVSFAASRDGVAWRRFDRSPFVRLGYRDQFDAASIYMCWGIVPSSERPDQELYLYYSGTDHCHGWGRQDKHAERNNRILTRAGLNPIVDSSGIGRVVIRRDGFTSVRGDYRGGTFTTPVLEFGGDSLNLNLDTSAVGEVSVEVQDEHGGRIEGFSHRTCRRLHSVNSVCARVEWDTEQKLQSLQGRPVRLSFRLRSADIYSFRFA